MYPISISIVLNFYRLSFCVHDNAVVLLFKNVEKNFRMRVCGYFRCYGKRCTLTLKNFCFEVIHHHHHQKHSSDFQVFLHFIAHQLCACANNKLFEHLIGHAELSVSCVSVPFFSFFILNQKFQNIL